MTTKQIDCCIELAKTLNFSRAAENLFISQSTLSQQIMNLESELGVKLFLRTTRDVQITEAGRAFLEEAAEILRRTEGLKQTISTYILRFVEPAQSSAG